MHFVRILLKYRFISIDAAWSDPKQAAPKRGKSIMSQHRSLKGSSKITAKRNVLKRFERINLLTERGQWKTGDRGLGLRKTKPAL